MSTDEMEAFLAEWIGLDASSIGSAAVERACRTRQEALGLAGRGDLLALVRDDAGERDRLVEEVVVSESWFFRDRQVFQFVAEFLATLAAMPGRAPVRILSVPCAGGEEPYSVAMALLDAGLPESAFRIDAFDVSHRSLARAAAARYSANAFRNADSTFRRRWFHDDAGTAVLDDRIRSLVTFRWGNLLEAGFATAKGPYDCIFCRNLLIYLTPPARAGVERTLSSILATDGLLLLGAAEPPILGGAWIPAGDASLFAVRRAVGRAAAAPPHPPQTSTKRSASGSRTRKPPTAPQGDRGERQSRVPAAATSRRTVADESSAALDRALEQAGALANQHRLSEAITVCESHARSCGPSPEIFFLEGMLHQSSGDLDRAEACFHKTLYLDPDHEEAALALVLVAGRRGDARMAEKYRESASRVIARKGSS
jgi:chemotaxis protein methyltransferase WspC